MIFVLVCLRIGYIQGQECVNCSFVGNFDYLGSKEKRMIDWFFPKNWEAGNWHALQLEEIFIQIMRGRCPECATCYYIIPRFIVEGTFLTLRAVLLVAFLYETSYCLTTKNCTWRSLADLLAGKICLSHSVLYKAVHAFGLTIETNEILRQLQIYTPGFFPTTEEVDDDWPPKKSLFFHTQVREVGVRKVLTTLWHLASNSLSQLRNQLNKLSDKIGTLFSTNGIKLAKLYPLARRT